MPQPITYLFVPADRPERFVKALSSGADRVIIDLEDAVTPKNKMAGRDAIKAGDLDWSRVIIRINDTGSTHFELDVAMIRHLPVQTVMVPKADGQGCLKRVDDALDNKRMLLPQIETVKSLFALPEILAADNVDRVAFGHLD
ncbi:MAG: aldolase/citrate lyase family protein, partial [Rhodobiaceae bacterium]